MVWNDLEIWKKAVNLAQQFLKGSSPNTSSASSIKSFNNARVAAKASPNTDERSPASKPVASTYPAPNTQSDICSYQNKHNLDLSAPAGSWAKPSASIHTNTNSNSNHSLAILIRLIPNTHQSLMSYSSA